MLPEEFRPVPVRGCEDFYNVSNHGRVVCALARRGSRGESYQLKPAVHTGGYLRVGLKDIHGEKKSILIHSLVARAFLFQDHGLDPYAKLGVGKGCLSVHHIDFNKANNCVDNLAIMLSTENISIGSPRKWALRGEGNPQVKLTEEQVIQIRSMLFQGAPQSVIAKNFLISRSTVTAIATRRNWKYLH